MALSAVPGTPSAWPHMLNHTVDNTLGATFMSLQALWTPTDKVNSLENAYHHMLQLRTAQPRGAHGHIGTYPLQAFKVWWLARTLTDEMRLSKPAAWPVVCEVGFGTGMSTAIMATATSSPTSSLIGGTHYIFDCRYCAGIAGGKTPSEHYLRKVFGDRCHFIEGDSARKLREFSKAQPNRTCGMISIDGAHTYPQVLNDIRAAWSVAHQETVLVFDDYQDAQVNRSISEAIAENLIEICQVYTAESPRFSDSLFSSNRAGRPAKWSAKLFVLARFVTGRTLHPKASTTFSCGHFRSRAGILPLESLEQDQPGQ